MNYRQELFSNLRVKAYLNHAAIAPIAKPVKQALEEVIQAYEQGGVKGLGIAMKNRESLRENLAKFFKVPVSHIGITQSTTDGLNWIAQSFPWQEGDRIVLFRGEFPANILPWLQAAKMWHLEIDWLDVSDLNPQSEALKAAFAKKPRLTAVSWVQYQSGQVTDMDALLNLAKVHGTAVAVDAIQGLGPLTWKWGEKADFIAGGGHKWLLGVEGCGYVCVSPKWVSQFNPINEGWLGQVKAIDFLLNGSGQVKYQKPFKADASRTERATFNHMGVAALSASTKMLLDMGLDCVSSKILEHASRIRTALAKRGLPVSASKDSGIVSFQPPQTENFSHWLGKLEQEGVIAASPDGYIRFSPHFYHPDSEIEEAIQAIARIF